MDSELEHYPAGSSQQATTIDRKQMRSFSKQLLFFRWGLFSFPS